MSLNKLVTLALLLDLVPNHTEKHCPCQRCRCRCHLYKLSHINLINQYRTVYEIYKLIRRNWFCILLTLLDISIVNNYRISYITAAQQDTLNEQLPKHTDFRTKLYMYLFSFFNDPTFVQRRTGRVGPLDIRYNSLILHQTEIRRTRTSCI